MFLISGAVLRQLGESTSQGGVMQSCTVDSCMRTLVESGILHLGAALVKIGRHIRDKLGNSPDRVDKDGVPVHPDLEPAVTKRMLEALGVSEVWECLRGMTIKPEATEATHTSARIEKGERRAAFLLYHILYLRSQKWSWVAGDLTATIGGKFGDAELDLLSAMGYTLSARRSRRHRALDAGSLDGTITWFFKEHVVLQGTRGQGHGHSPGRLYEDLYAKTAERHALPRGAVLCDNSCVGVARGQGNAGQCRLDPLQGWC